MSKNSKLEQTIKNALKGSSKKQQIIESTEEVENELETSEEEIEDQEDAPVEAKEETEAASSLKPAARAVADPQALSQSKLGMMSGVMQVMSGMDKDAQVNFFNQVMSQFGPGKTYGVDDKSEQNKSTLNMKPSAAPGGSWDVKMSMPQLSKEEIEVMFTGQDLTEEAKEKMSVLFEAAVNAKVIAETARIEEEMQHTITEELKVFTEELTDKLDSYLDYVVETWMKENEVAIESTLRNEISEEFINGLKNLFTEHYIDVPESKIDVLETLTVANEELEANLNATLEENIEMKKILSEVAKNDVFEDLSEGLVLSQKEKFKTLAEAIEFDGDIEVYEKKLRIVKETYFNNASKAPVSSNIQEETFEGETETVAAVDPDIERYVQAISRTVKK